MYVREPQIRYEEIGMKLENNRILFNSMRINSDYDSRYYSNNKFINILNITTNKEAFDFILEILNVYSLDDINSVLTDNETYLMLEMETHKQHIKEYSYFFNLFNSVFRSDLTTKSKSGHMISGKAIKHNGKINLIFIPVLTKDFKVADSFLAGIEDVYDILGYVTRTNEPITVNVKRIYTRESTVEYEKIGKTLERNKILFNTMRLITQYDRDEFYSKNNNYYSRTIDISHIEKNIDTFDFIKDVLKIYNLNDIIDVVTDNENYLMFEMNTYKKYIDDYYYFINFINHKLRLDLAKNSSGGYIITCKAIKHNGKINLIFIPIVTSDFSEESGTVDSDNYIAEDFLARFEDQSDFLSYLNRMNEPSDNIGYLFENKFPNGY